jgi:hypothetical protein
MRLDSLVRLIESADPTAFRELGLLCLERRGFAPHLTDGPYDGGKDFSVYVAPPQQAPFAVQLSVERDWEKKLKADAARVKARLGIQQLLFVSSRRIPEASFQDVGDELSRTLGIIVQKMDAQAMASLAIARGFASRVLEILGIAVPPPSSRPFQRPDMRQDAAYACAFFGTEAQSFRKTTIEQTILAVVSPTGSARRDDVVQQVALTLGLALNQQGQIRSALDRMIQDGRLRGHNGTVTMDPDVLDGWRALRALQDQNRGELRREVEALLVRHSPGAPGLPAAVDALMEDLGALWLATAAASSQGLSGQGLPGIAQDPLSERLRHLHRTLDVLGLAEGMGRDGLLQELTRCATNSAFGKTLAAGELFLDLLGLRTPHLLRALGERQEMCVVLDTSVAIPLLCCLLYEPAAQRFFIAAQHAYDQTLAHGIRLVLPADYLEEVASHLIAALRDYGDVAGLDPDFRSSQNAFVAHYAALRHAGKAPMDFPTYLEGFGLFARHISGDFYAARDALMRDLRRLAVRYNIHTEPLASSEQGRRWAEEHITRAQSDLDMERPRVLLQHDARTLGWLHDNEVDGDRAYVLCTWDRLLLGARRTETLGWDALDPVVLGDVLSLAASPDDEIKLVSPVVVALSLSEAEAERGAKVWDFLARTERERLHDATLRRAALAFKRDWMERAREEPRSKDMQAAWERWKGEHLPQGGGQPMPT